MKKRLLIVLLSVTLLATSLGKSAMAAGEYYWPTGVQVTAPAAIVMEATTGTILYEKNIHETYYPASITKILTTLIALENCNLSEIVTFSKNAIYKTEGTSISRDVGEQMTLEDTLYAVMLGSANECAYATAEHVGEDYETFITMMNEKAKELGCEDSHFNNPHGLPDTDHYTSAYDMAIISRAAILNDKFRAITGTSKHTIPATNKHDEPTYLVNHHAMLNYYHTSKYIYDKCIGGKTGYTQAARHTLVTYAYKDGMTLICVVLNVDTTENQYKDTKRLLEYCFDNYQMFNVVDNDADYDIGSVLNTTNFTVKAPYFTIDDQAMIILPKTASFTDARSEMVPVSNEEGVVGRIDYYYGDRRVGFANVLYTGAEVEEYSFRDYKEAKTEEDRVLLVLNAKVIAVVVIAILLLALIIYVIIYLKRNINVIRYEMAAKKERKRKASQFRGAEFNKRRRRRFK
ncbi:MAG: D-alanyl-D-alanine carboxypeptidase [Lachnospiraceae bacterium]|nr:D-alanyl-D-alanine carboxypeptidase [Lachnospiraceae bacterium]